MRMPEEVSTASEVADVGELRSIHRESARAIVARWASAVVCGVCQVARANPPPNLWQDPSRGGGVNGRRYQLWAVAVMRGAEPALVAGAVAEVLGVTPRDGGAFELFPAPRLGGPWEGRGGTVCQGARTSSPS